MNWFAEYIEDTVIHTFLEKLTAALARIHADPHAGIERRYGRDLWQLYQAVEKGEQEDDFYYMVNTADTVYEALEGSLNGLLEDYFVEVHTALIELGV